MAEIEKLQNEDVNLPEDTTVMEHWIDNGSYVAQVKTEDSFGSEDEQIFVTPLKIEIAELNTEVEELARLNPASNGIVLSAASRKINSSGEARSTERNPKTSFTITKELDIRTDHNCYENVLIKEEKDLTDSVVDQTSSLESNSVDVVTKSESHVVYAAGKVPSAIIPKTEELDIKTDNDGCENLWIKEENDSLVESKNLADPVIHQNSSLESNNVEVVTKSEDTADVDILKTLTPEGDVIFSCRFCDFTNKKRYRVKGHENSHHLKTTLHHCRLCDYSNVNYSSVQTHESRKHKPPHFYKCKFCDLVAKHKYELRRHENAKHLKVKLHKCQLCEFTTFYKSSLRDHKNYQHGPKESYKCAFCEYTSRRKKHLHQHENAKHHKSTLYMCQQCDFMSCYKHSLRNHEKNKHSSTFMYKCHFCDYSAKLSYQLRRHIRSKHSKPNS